MSRFIKSSIDWYSQFSQDLLSKQVTPEIYQTDIPEECLDNVRSIIKQQLIQQLQEIYVYSWRIASPEIMNIIASHFVDNPNNWPKSNNFDEWGDAFLRFFCQRKELNNIKYLADIANLDWLIHYSGTLPVKQSISNHHLHILSWETIKDASVEFQPCLQLLKSNWDLIQIVQDFNHRQLSTKAQKLAHKECYILIYNDFFKGRQICHVRESMWNFITLLQNGDSVENAASKLNKKQTFDFEKTISYLISNNLITAFN